MDTEFYGRMEHARPTQKLELRLALRLQSAKGKGGITWHGPERTLPHLLIRAEWT